MAAKGQKFKSYEATFREKIINESLKNGALKTAKKYDINVATIRSWIWNMKKGKLNSKKGPNSNTKKIKELEKQNKIYKQIIDSLKNGDIEKIEIKNGINELCKILEISRSTFYRWKNTNMITPKKIQDQKDIAIIKKIFDDNLQQFGYRRIQNELKKQNIFWNHKKIKRLMNLGNIRAEYVRKFKKIELSRKNQFNGKRIDDLIKRKFKAINAKFEVLYTDVTYHILNKKRIYQSTIIDGFSKEILDYKISEENNLDLVMKNVFAAIKKIKNEQGSLDKIILHSDQGFQYTSKTYKYFASKNKIKLSYSNSCYDNAVIESFHSLLKRGTIYNNNFKTIKEYIKSIVNWCAWYNNYKRSTFFNKNILLKS